MAVWRALRACALLAFAAASSAVPVAELPQEVPPSSGPPEAWAVEEAACDASAEEPCALSLLQRRARGVPGGVAASVAGEEATADGRGTVGGAVGGVEADPDSAPASAATGPLGQQAAVENDQVEPPAAEEAEDEHDLEVEVEDELEVLAREEEEEEEDEEAEEAEEAEKELEVHPDAWPKGMALPGGWGEADAFAQEVMRDLEAVKAGKFEATAEGSWGSCARYKCSNRFVRWHTCQCNWNCRSHGNCCGDFWSHCTSRRRAPRPTPPRRRAPSRRRAPPPPPTAKPGVKNIMTLYHQTGSAIGPLILKNGFRSGTRGWCGGGIYFAISPEDTFTKAIGADSHTGFMIEAKVDVGRLKAYPRTCDTSLTGKKLEAQGYDSSTFNPGDGPEYIVYSPDRVLSTKQIPL